MARGGWMIAVLASVFALTTTAFGQDQDTNTLVGKPAPDFSLKTVDGKDVKLSDQKGHVVVVDFWATWCPPCRASLPHVQKVSADADLAAKGVVVWAVNDREDVATINSFLNTNHYTFTVPLDNDGATLGTYLVRGIPTTVIVGRDGVIQNVFVGFDPDQSAAAIDQAITKAVAATAPGK